MSLQIRPSTSNTLHLMNGSVKDVFIRNMAADVLGKRFEDVSEKQFTSAKTLFLAKAYNAAPEVITNLEAAIRSA